MRVVSRVYSWLLLACFASASSLPAFAQSVTVSPTSLSFGNQVQGVASSVQKVTLKNGQSKAITVTSITPSLSDYKQTNTCPVSPSTLAAGRSCTISVTFTPGALGSRTGTLTVTDTGTNSPQTVSLSGTGIAAVTASPSSISFGNQVIGVKSAASKVTVTNNQNKTLTITKIATSLSTDYTTTTTCPLSPKTLGAGSNCSVSVFFTPTAAGTRSATLTISDNASVSPTVSLSGTGIVPAVASPNSLTFASQALGTSSLAQTVTLTNNQSTSLTITSVTSNLSDFLVSSSCPSTLAAGASCTASVTFSPKAQGSRIGTLSFSDSANNSPQTVSLNGTGGPPALVSIAVTPANPSITAGATLQFTATGTYTDSSTQNLTNSVSWNSSAPGIASIGSTGLAAGATQGGTSITAISGSIAGSTNLTVGPPVLVSISVSPATASIPAGTNQQFAATGTYSDGSTQDLTNSVSWTSSAPGVASILTTGLATGTGIGNATITASSGSITGSAALAVGQPALVSIAVTPANASFALGTAQALKATGTYTDGSTQDLTTTVTWSTADSTIATIDSQGNATSVAVGGTSISAVSGSISGSTTLTVTPAALVSIAVTPAIPSIPSGTTLQFAATGTFTDGTTQDVTQSVQWTSDTPSVAAISNAASQIGLATSVSTGTATITATSASISGSTTLNVTAAVLVSIAVTPANLSIALGTTQLFTATGTFTDGSTQDLTSTATWSSDAPLTAGINNAGLATSLAEGTANISATSGNIAGSAALTVTAAQLVSLAINPQTATVPLGLTQQFTATGTYTDGSTQDATQSAHWSSTDAGVATISDASGTQGLATTLSPGTTTIGISSGSVNASATLTVNSAALASIAISPQAPVIALGTSQQFTALGTYTDGTTQDVTSLVTWDSSSATVLVISNAAGTNGLATSSGLGTATVTATSGSISSATTATVGPAAISSIAVTPAATSIAQGYTLQFAAIATYSDGSTQDVTQSTGWSSSVLSVASINLAGLASALWAGTTTISATSGSVSGSTTLTVSPPVPVSLSISPTNPSIYVSGQQQFTATLFYSDGSWLDVTSSATWTSSATGVAAIGSSGLAVGASAGSTTIEAMWGTSLTATTSMSVLLPTVTIIPSNASIAISGTQQFSVTVTGSSNQSVTWAVDGITGGNSSVGTISAGGLYVGPPMIGYHAITATAQANSASLGNASLTLGSLIPVANTFFGLHLHYAASAVPGTMEGTGRIWDSNAAQWPNLNPASGTFVWTNLDNVLASYKNAGINDILYTLWRVPYWASSDKTDAKCDYANIGPAYYGECDLPTDLSPDGTGTNFTWRNWVQNIAQHVNDPTYLQTHAKISYWEPCNECYRSPILDPGYGSGGGQVAYRGTYAQLVRMMQDARCIILGNTSDPITALNTTCGQAGYPVIGIDPTAKMVMPSTSPIQVGKNNPPYPQVTQNLLYCTCSNNSCSTTASCTTGSAGSKAIDILSVHIYPSSYVPEQIPSEVAIVRSYLQPSELRLPFWSDEGGWGGNAQVQDPDLQAAWIARFHIMMWASGLGRAYWYEWDNAAYGTLWSPTSITNCTTPFTSGYLCSGGIAYQKVHDWLVGSTLTNCSVSGTTWTCNLQYNGAAAQIVWDTSQTCSNGTCGTIQYSVSSTFNTYQDLAGTSHGISGTVPVGIKPILLFTQ